MAVIETSLQPRQKWWNILYAVICAGLALWGAYDYWVTIPRREAAVAAYDAAAKEVEEIESKARAAGQAPGGAAPLSEPEVARYQEAKKVVDAGKPVAPAAYDRPVQMWLYIVGCGVLGAPWFLWQWLATARHRYRLDEDGTLHVDGTAYRPAEIVDVEMSRWMAKSIATAVTASGARIDLDDYKYRNMHLIVGALAVRFHPEDWTADAKDLRKIRAQEAAAAPSGGGEA